MDIDLDINNYDFQELLELFDIRNDFTHSGLKKAYKQVLMTHPDKSRLDKKYFLFFSKAFKLIKKVYDYSHKKETCVSRQVYTDNDKDKSIQDLINKIDKKEFNRKFNELFEKVKFEDEEQDNGYSDWLKSDDGLIHIQTHNVRDMNDEIDKIKTKHRELVIHKDIEDVQSGQGGYSLMRNKPQEYSSGLFSKLQFEDVKKAHSETVVPVTIDDYTNRTRFNNINDLNIYRKQNETIPDEKTSRELLIHKARKEEEENVQNAYKMMKQMEKIEESHRKWNANFLLLTNNI